MQLKELFPSNALPELPQGQNAGFTTNFGEPVYSNNYSLTVGTRGPVLLEEFEVLEKLATINREVIPQRVVHARGTSAKGIFKVTDDITNYTSADVFSFIGKSTDVIVGFSQVTGLPGSPEWLRDPRGFAVKFYTDQGNWDLVGNNFPVFFIRDGDQFPDLVHAAKINPANGLNDAWRQADFFSWHPESMNVLTYLLDDVGIPQDFRHMNGSGVHTFTLINKANQPTFVKFHWLPTLGEKNLLESDIPALAAKSPDGYFARKDLVDSINSGAYPEWYLYIQTLDPANQDNYTFDPLDPTKIWPEAQFPMKRVGTLTLNRNIDNFFNENEQLAFSVAHVVPGIGYSNDKLMQWRLMAYDDTQRYRIGPNFALLPVNRPRCPLRNNRQDGPMNFAHQHGAVNYYPSEYAEAAPIARPPMNSAPIDTNSLCQPLRTVIDKQDNFRQAGDHFRSWDSPRQGRFINRLTDLLTAPKVNKGIQDRWMSYLQQVDGSLASKVGAILAAAGPGSSATFEPAPRDYLEGYEYLAASAPAAAPMAAGAKTAASAPIAAGAPMASFGRHLK
ncbi:hypothetical protein WJX81_004808 [Elliptochloris bilobata]|uniref:catalase n=1 Tax=Elliptochloris bilobata TaxID=381761 RepID=A0AAW1S3M2_9CHLO